VRETWGTTRPLPGRRARPWNLPARAEPRYLLATTGEPFPLTCPPIGGPGLGPSPAQPWRRLGPTRLGPGDARLQELRCRVPPSHRLSYAPGHYAPGQYAPGPFISGRGASGRSSPLTARAVKFPVVGAVGEGRREGEWGLLGRVVHACGIWPTTSEAAPEPDR
jgi:hypothetical protein